MKKFVVCLLIACLAGCGKYEQYEIAGAVNFCGGVDKIDNLIAGVVTCTNGKQTSTEISEFVKR